MKCKLEIPEENKEKMLYTVDWREDNRYYV